jgi:parvulin-like peptidyl-prolyl isomerase
MPTTRTLPLLALLGLVLPVGSGALAQTPANPPPAATGEAAPGDSRAAQDPSPQKLAWPRDRDRVVCRVGGRDRTLLDLLEHLEDRHFPGMVALMDAPTGAAYLEHPLLASWVRQYADVLALETIAKQRGRSFASEQEALGNALKKGFEQFLDGYVASRERRGSPVELTQARIDLLLADYQRDHGLECEVRGWLDALVPEVSVEETQRLRDFYNDFAQWFGGIVTISQILVEHRDPRTLELKTGAARERAYAKLADIEARLAPDGSNFEELARLHSDDARTARIGGRMQGIERFDERLPAVICRTAWQLRDGEISKPVESAFGIHLIKRISYRHRYYVIFNDAIKQEIADTIRRSGQEDLLFRARDELRVELRY